MVAYATHERLVKPPLSVFRVTHLACHCSQMVHLLCTCFFALLMYFVQAGWLANMGVQDATNDQLQQSLSAMQANFDTFLHATQQAGQI